MAGRPGELVSLGRQALPPYSPSSGGAGKGSLLRGGVRPTEAKGAGDSTLAKADMAHQGWVCEYGCKVVPGAYTAADP